jgi:Uma2 family endonuclease
MGMPALTERFWTGPDVRALPDDGKRYECIDGALLVTPSPRLDHQSAVLRLYDRLAPYVDAFSIGDLFLSPADLELTAGTLVQPDLFVARVRGGVPRARQCSEYASLRLAVEVLLPTTARYDRFTKREFYRRAGVEEYWIVDLDARLIERWQPAADRPEVLAERLTWQPEGSAEPLVLELEAYFRDALGA